MKTQFNVKLSDAERARLERHRAELGLRSHADVIRHWINQSPPASDGRLDALAKALGLTDRQYLVGPIGNNALDRD